MTIRNPELRKIHTISERTKAPPGLVEYAKKEDTKLWDSIYTYLKLPTKTGDKQMEFPAYIYGLLEAIKYHRPEDIPFDLEYSCNSRN